MIGDLSEQAVITRVTETAMERFGRVDVLVNNAGIMDRVSALADVSDAEWERVISFFLGPEAESATGWGSGRSCRTALGAASRRSLRW